MKETDLNVVYTTAQNVLEQNEYDLVELIGRNIAAMAVANIYNMFDMTEGYGQNFSTDVSLITGQSRMSVIIANQMSFYKPIDDLVSYEDLQDDLCNIAMVIQTVIDRIKARG